MRIVRCMMHIWYERRLGSCLYFRFLGDWFLLHWQIFSSVLSILTWPYICINQQTSHFKKEDQTMFPASTVPLMDLPNPTVKYRFQSVGSVLRSHDTEVTILSGSFTYLKWTEEKTFVGTARFGIHVSLCHRDSSARSRLKNFFPEFTWSVLQKQLKS
jgi:hypothetical protein